jgi:hypothetical protein
VRDRARRRPSRADYPGRVLPLLKYSVMRLALFVAAMGLLWLVQIKGLLNILLAALISLLLSYLLLRRPREELSQQIAEKVASRHLSGPSSSRGLGMDDDSETEDAELDRAENAANPDAPKADGAKEPAPADPPARQPTEG